MFLWDNYYSSCRFLLVFLILLDSFAFGTFITVFVELAWWCWFCNLNRRFDSFRIWTIFYGRYLFLIWVLSADEKTCPLSLSLFIFLCCLEFDQEWQSYCKFSINFFTSPSNIDLLSSGTLTPSPKTLRSTLFQGIKFYGLFKFVFYVFLPSSPIVSWVHPPLS